MEKPGTLRVTAIIAGILFAAEGHAQVREDDEWSGILKRKGKQKETITLNVKYSDGVPKITAMLYAGTSFEFKRQRFNGDRLTFSWTPGNDDVDCRLEMLHCRAWGAEHWPEAEGGGSEPQ